MSELTIGMVHPGQMGASIGAALVNNEYRTLWASAGRSAATADRAAAAGLEDIGDLKSLCAQSSIIFSICPPDRAKDVAREVASTGYQQSYVDCNAISPASGQEVGAIVEAAGGKFVDAGIIGPPAIKPGNTRLYLSGNNASEIADCFQDSLVDARVLNAEPGAASALKMAYAAWSKGSTALLMNAYALARARNVDAALETEWELSAPDLYDRLSNRGADGAAKAWRFVGEMQEIAASFEQAGLPRAWFDGAAESYSQLEEFKDQRDVPVERIIDTLLNNRND